MKKIILYFLQVYENCVNNLVLYFGTFFISILLLYTFYYSDEFATSLMYSRNGHFDDYVFVNSTYYNMEEVELFGSEIEKTMITSTLLNSLGDISYGEYIPNLTLGDYIHKHSNGDPTTIEIYYPGTPSIIDMQIRLSQGRYPEKNNEVVLNYEASSVYSLNEIITIVYVQANDEKTDFSFHPVTVQVVGFMEKSKLFKSPDTLVSPNQSLIHLLYSSSIEDYYGFSSEPFTVADDGCPITIKNSSSFSNNILACRSTSGKSPEALKSEIIKHFPILKNSAVTGEELSATYIKECRILIAKIITYDTIILLLLACFLIGSLYLHARKKALEMTVMYMNGMTWISSISMMFASYLPGVVLGIGCGIYCYYPLSIRFFESRSYFRIEYVVISSGICLILALLCMIPLYIELMRRPPVETIRKE